MSPKHAAPKQAAPLRLHRRALAGAIALLICAGGVAAMSSANSPTSERTSIDPTTSTSRASTTLPALQPAATLPTSTTSGPPATALEPAVDAVATDTVPETFPPELVSPILVVAVGDIVCSPSSASYNGGAGTARSCRHTAVMELTQSLAPTWVLPLGDIQYECGLAEEWVAFDLTWGQFGDLLRPAVGNHEYGHACGVDDASPYFNYFGARAGDPGHGWYSFDSGGWHFIALNSECSYGGGSVGGCGINSPQRQWLLNDLTAHPAQCTLAYWHEPRFTSGQHGNATQMATMWNDLAAAGADVVLAGHNHVYERFEPIGISVADPVLDSNGIRSFVVGTGGKNLVPFTAPPVLGQAARNDNTYGVLGLTLRSGGYDWQFVPLDGGGGFTDEGSGDCH